MLKQISSKKIHLQKSGKNNAPNTGIPSKPIWDYKRKKTITSLIRTSKRKLHSEDCKTFSIIKSEKRPEDINSATGETKCLKVTLQTKRPFFGA